MNIVFIIILYCIKVKGKFQRVAQWEVLCASGVGADGRPLGVLG